MDFELRIMERQKKKFKLRLYMRRQLYLLSIIYEHEFFTRYVRLSFKKFISVLE